MRRRSSKNSGKTTDVVDWLTADELAKFDWLSRAMYEDIRDKLMKEKGRDWMLRNREAARLEMRQVFGTVVEV